MKAKADAKSKRYDVLRSMLEDRRQEIHEKLRTLRETLPAEIAEVKDDEERSVADFVQEIDFTLMQMKSETLAKIDDALRRVEDGSYGTCADCLEPIAEARLKALPFADLCRDCQEAQELRVAEARASEARLPPSELTPLG
jgi:DnaK suppressor protein